MQNKKNTKTDRTVEYIIVQAGGKGTRMEKLTRNKPKALIPVQNLPMLFHLFRRYPDRKFIIIGDYKYDVLERYLQEFAEEEYSLICATGHTGTCAGLAEAVSLVPEGKRFMLIWCDLILSDDYMIPETDNNIIGISKDFPCRWKYENGEFTEERSSEQGVAGHFIFRNKSFLEGVPKDGEFVRWLKEQGLRFEEQPLYRTHEYGLYSEWKKLPENRCRPFNRIQIENGRFYKEAVDEQGQRLALREVAWYRKAMELGVEGIPHIYGFQPLCMELVDGVPIYECEGLTEDRKKAILKKVIVNLKQLHSLGSVPAEKESYWTAYIGKTFERLNKVHRLVPFADEETVKVNGRLCRNVFCHREELEREVLQYLPSKFRFIHGDCTFSNMMLKSDGETVLIDPRGYFGTTEIYGDPAYDWVKLYYSLYSNYDQFNLKRFDLTIGENEVELSIDSNCWEGLERYFFEMLDGEVTERQMKLLMAIVWLSLTTYVWEDYDSICGAFYNGLYYLEEVL